jgi:hypothetical protein
LRSAHLNFSERHFSERQWPALRLPDMTAAECLLSAERCDRQAKACRNAYTARVFEDAASHWRHLAMLADLAEKARKLGKLLEAD